jgi:predicted metalloprotease with PDZ domain
MKFALLALSVGAAMAGGCAVAQTAPQPAAPSTPIEAPRDIPYPGVLRLAVDATDLAHAIFAVHETVPVAGAGPVTLLYPEWLPGNHSPTGPIDKLAGLIITAAGSPVAWRRDPVDMYAFHVDVPAGAGALDLTFQFLSPVTTREGRVMMTPDMLSLQWNTLALYPAGYFSRQIAVEPSVRLPDGFTLASALEKASTTGRRH